MSQYGQGHSPGGLMLGPQQVVPSGSHLRPVVTPSIEEADIPEDR